MARSASARSPRGTAAKTAAIKAVFDEGVVASRGGNHDLAIEKFNQASTMLPNCYDCFYNIGFASAVVVVYFLILMVMSVGLMITRQKTSWQ